MFKKTVKAMCFFLLSVTLVVACGCTNGGSTDDGSREKLLLANKQNPLGESYVPEKLSAIPTDLTLYGKEIGMETEAAEAAVRLLRALHVEGYTDIVITSGYRSYSYQQSLFNTYLSQEQGHIPY